MRSYRRKRKTDTGMTVLCVITLLAIIMTINIFVSATASNDLSTSDESSPILTDEATPEPSHIPADEATPEPSIDPAVESTQTQDFPIYSFGSYLEKSEPITDDTFFDNAVFLGDSRTEGLQLYSGLTHGDFFWRRGMTVFRVDSEEWTFEIGGENLTMIEALGKKQYDSVYIMIEVNELGYPVSSYERSLGIFIDKVITAQPDAVIYLQTIPPVNDQVAKESKLGSYINNENVNTFNEVIIRMATEKRVVLLNTAEIFRGTDGQLPADMTSDGCHFKYGSYSLWADYLRCHIIDPARYHYYRETPDRLELVD